MTWTFYAAAGAIGPVILGRTFDATGSYSSLLILLAGVLPVAAGQTFCFRAIQIRSLKGARRWGTPVFFTRDFEAE
jgi:hypothetical protein